MNKTIEFNEEELNTLQELLWLGDTVNGSIEWYTTLLSIQEKLNEVENDNE